MININITIDDKEILTELNGKLDHIIREIKKMSEAGDAMKTAITDMSAKVDDIANDVTTLMGMIPAEGGMSAAEAAEVRTALEALQTKLTTAAGIFPPQA